MNTRRIFALALVLIMWISSVAMATPAFADGMQGSFTLAKPEDNASMTGAIFATNSTCTGVNLNLSASKQDVYLDGGPRGQGGPGLPNGLYYVQVTEPNGDRLGYSTAAVVSVSDGSFGQCYHLWAILVYPNGTTPGYDDTTNPGGEYKVWVSQNPAFPHNESKTDNFKVKGSPPEPGNLSVLKFYDANANGDNDDGQLITGWKIRIEDTIDYVRYTPVTILVDPDDYTVTEFYPLETNWMPTTPNPVFITLGPGEEETVEFGNLCLSAGGGKTLGFWSNKNAQKLFGADDLALMVSLNLRTADGSDFDPTSYGEFRTWLLSAKAQKHGLHAFRAVGGHGAECVQRQGQRGRANLRAGDKRRVSSRFCHRQRGHGRGDRRAGTAWLHAGWERVPRLPGGAEERTGQCQQQL